MSNERRIIQVAPRKGLSAVIAVRKDSDPELHKLIADEQRLQHFYCIFFKAGRDIEFPNLDGPDTFISPSTSDCIAIQSGGKMWCGYDAFVEFLRSLAPHSEDSRFFIGDELGYIDEFRFIERTLQYNRVHQGGWRPLDEFVDHLNAK